MDKVFQNWQAMKTVLCRTSQ